MYLIKFYNLLSPIICPWWLSGKESAYQCRRHKFNPWVVKIPLEKEMATHSNILAGKSHARGAWQATIHGVTKSQTRPCE